MSHPVRDLLWSGEFCEVLVVERGEVQSDRSPAVARAKFRARKSPDFAWSRGRDDGTTRGTEQSFAADPFLDNRPAY